MAESVARTERCSSRAVAIADAFEREAHPLAERIQRARAQAAAASEARDFTAVLAKAAKESATAAAVEAARSFMADEHCLPSESSAVEAQGGSRSAPMEKAAAEGTAMQVEPVGGDLGRPSARCCGRKRDIDRPHPRASGRPSGARAHRLPLHPCLPESRPAPGNDARAGPAGRRAAGASAPHHGIERRSHGRSYRPHRRTPRPTCAPRASPSRKRSAPSLPWRRPSAAWKTLAGPPASSRSQRLPEGLHRHRYGTPRLHHRPLGHYGARPHGHPSALGPRSNATEGLHAFVSDAGDLMLQVAGLPGGIEAVEDGEVVTMEAAPGGARTERLLADQHDFCAVYDEIAGRLLLARPSASPTLCATRPHPIPPSAARWRAVAARRGAGGNGGARLGIRASTEFLAGQG